MNNLKVGKFSYWQACKKTKHFVMGWQMPPCLPPPWVHHCTANVQELKMQEKA